MRQIAMQDSENPLFKGSVKTGHLGVFLRSVLQWAFVQAVVVSMVLTPAAVVRANPLAIALLDPAVLGATVVVGGALAAAGAAAYYAPAGPPTPASFSVTAGGQVASNLYEAVKYSLPSGKEEIIGGMAQLAVTIGQAGDSVYNWMYNHRPSLPALGSIFRASIPRGGPFAPGAVDPTHGPLPYMPIGSVNTADGTFDGFTSDQTPVIFKVTGGWSAYNATMMACLSDAVTLPALLYRTTGYAYFLTSRNTSYGTCSGGTGHVASGFWATASPDVGPPLTWPDGPFDPVGFKQKVDTAATTNSTQIFNDINTIIINNLPAVTNATQLDPTVVSQTLATGIAQQAAVTAKTAADASTNPLLSVAVAQAQAAKDQAVAQSGVLAAAAVAAQAAADAAPGDTAKEVAASQAATAAAQAQAAVVAATTALTAAQTALAASPLDPAKQLAADQAQALADKTAADAQAPAPAKPVTLAPEVMPAIPGAPGLTLPDIPTVDQLEFWTPIHTAMAALTASLVTHEPFASLMTIGPMLDTLTAAPAAPVITFDLPVVGSVVVDLTPWDPVAEICRAGFSLLAIVGLTLFVLKIWV
jgi:hypothetical protein